VLASKCAIIALTLSESEYVLREVLMIIDGLLEFSSDLFQYSELDSFVKSLAS